MSARQIVIGGFGAAGTSTALALLSGGMAPADLLIFDSNPTAGGPSVGPDARILALNAGSRRFLTAIGAWERLAPEAHPMRAIAISDTALEEDIRPRLLNMTTLEEGEPLAHLVPLGLLNATLRDLCREAGVEVTTARLAGFSAGDECIEVDLGAMQVSARLLIGADGAKSPVRMKAGIPTHGWAYGQTAIVATIRHSLPHHGEAVQHFLPSGPFALLPLDEGRSSIVWSEKAAVAAEILAADAEAQRRAIAARAAGWRGEILAVEAISTHPLQLRLARRFIDKRLALVADAAHVVHPLAGQGLNLGFEDAAMLAELIVERLRLGLDPGAPDLLELYQARRRPAAAGMAFATEGINRLFSNDSSPLRMLRDFGAGLVERFPGAKTRLMAAASGQTWLSPRLFRGEAI
jgi:2-octaprenyl-6-methoxyphenol hydroxylase